MSLPTPLPTRKLGPFNVSAISLGCMNLSHAYGVPPSAEEGAAFLLKALDMGITHFDSAALYGFGVNEELVGRTLAPHRDKFILASKGGMVSPEGKRVIDGSPAALIRNCEESLKRLRTDVIDIYYLHRWDKKVPIEESMGALAKLVSDGKIKTVGLCEVSADTLRKAHAVHPIAAVQTEYSLWTRNPEIAVLKACKEIGAAFVAFSPLARAYLTAKLRNVTNFAPKDFRLAMPRFTPENYAANMMLLSEYEKIANEVGCTPAQLALAWLLAKDDCIIPIPGTTNLLHLEENLAAAEIKLSAEIVAQLDALINQQTIHGARYNPATQAEIDTEEF